MAEDQERIIFDEFVKLEKSVAILFDHADKDAQSLAHAADAINKLAVRVAQLEECTALSSENHVYSARIFDKLLRRIEALEKGESNGTETRNESNGGRVVSDDGGDDENPIAGPGVGLGYDPN